MGIVDECCFAKLNVDYVFGSCLKIAFTVIKNILWFFIGVIVCTVFCFVIGVIVYRSF